jgi:hypothetical protein
MKTGEIRGMPQAPSLWPANPPSQPSDLVEKIHEHRNSMPFSEELVRQTSIRRLSLSMASTKRLKLGLIRGGGVGQTIDEGCTDSRLRLNG